MTAVDTAGVLQQQITDSSAAAVTAIDTAAAVNDVVEVLQKLDSSAVSNDSSVVRCSAVAAVDTAAAVICCSAAVTALDEILNDSSGLIDDSSVVLIERCSAVAAVNTAAAVNCCSAVDVILST